MSTASTITTTDTVRELHKNSVNNLFEAYKSVAVQHATLVDGIEYNFDPRLEQILSLVFLKKNPTLLSREQYKMYTRYVNQAANLIDADLKQLDIFLGSL